MAEGVKFGRAKSQAEGALGDPERTSSGAMHRPRAKERTARREKAARFLSLLRFMATSILESIKRWTIRRSMPMRWPRQATWFYIPICAIIHPLTAAPIFCASGSLWMS